MQTPGIFLNCSYGVSLRTGLLLTIVRHPDVLRHTVPISEFLSTGKLGAGNEPAPMRAETLGYLMALLAESRDTGGYRSPVATETTVRVFPSHCPGAI